jgi:hypothetical protein
MIAFDDLVSYEVELRKCFATKPQNFLETQYERASEVKRECDPRAVPILYKRISLMQKVLLEELDKQNVLI